LKNGEGLFDIMALGFIPIARAENSSSLMRGELMRYLAGLAWAPAPSSSIRRFAGAKTVPTSWL
jgi:hypothetical protein